MKYSETVPSCCPSRNTCGPWLECPWWELGSLPLAGQASSMNSPLRWHLAAGKLLAENRQKKPTN
jgi:hypothetical protein